MTSSDAPRRTRIKICCMASVEEAALAVSLGVDAVGLVSAMPSGPGPIDEDVIAEIARTVPPGVATFLLTCLTDAEAIAAQHRRCRTTTLQLVDHVTPDGHAALRESLPGIGIVQVVHVRDVSSVSEAVAHAATADALLLDSGNPSLAVKELGGTGRVHDWSLSRRIVQESAKPVWLAGGLRPENVEDAIRTAHPFGVDVCSGLRTNGRLDPGRAAAFVAAVRRADAAN